MMTPNYRGVVAVAWLATLLTSWLLDIAFVETLGSRDPFLPMCIQGGGLAILLGISAILRPFRPACEYVLVMIALFVGDRLLGHWLVDQMDGAYVLRHFGFMWWIVIQRLALLPAATLMTVVFFCRLRRRDWFLRWGAWSAPYRWSLLFPFPVRTWSAMFPIACMLTVVLLGTVLLLTIGIDWSGVDALPRNLIAILVFSVFNAAVEEYTARVIPLSVLQPVVGARPAIAMTAVHFGIGHWYGQPSGPLGVLLMTYAGWAFAKSMVETRGAGWAFCVHVFGDFLIMCLVVMANGW